MTESKLLPFIALLCLVAGLFQGAQAQVEMSDRWDSLMKLIEQEERTIRSLDRLSPQLRFRLLELQSEKMNLIKQRENQAFLKESPEVIHQRGRDYFFRTSQRLEREAQQMGLAIIKDFPRFINIPDIYYTLALNSRDYGKNQDTERFLLEALKLSDERTPVIYSVRVALAEHYYNENQYQKAISLYTLVLRNLGDEWHTKHLYNAAWCFLKINNLNMAIDLLVRSHDLGLTSRYISMKEQVLESAQAFFVLGERVDEGIEFYLKNAENPSPYLIRMAHRTAERGEFNNTQKIIERNIKLANSKQNWSGLIDIHLQQLDIYRNFKRYDLHMQVSVALDKLQEKQKFSEEQSEDAIRKITEVVGYLQIRLTNNAKVRQTNHDPELLKSVIDYFDILSSLDPTNSDRYSFFQGESFFSITQYRNAGLAYQRALEHSKRDHEDAPERDELRRKILDSLLAVLEFGNLQGEEKERFTIYTFTNYLTYWPVDEKSRLIYRSLFNLYLQKNDINRALAVLHTYQQHYGDNPNREIQRGMLTQVIDLYIKEKNSDRLAYWINQINQGYLSFPAEYTERATLILGQILFENFAALAQNGSTLDAIKGYTEVFEDERYPIRIKSQASLQIALLSLQLNRQQESFDWLIQSISLTERAELDEILPRLITVHEVYFLKQNFELSYQLADRIIDLYCRQDISQKKMLYQNSIAFKLIDGKTQDAIRTLAGFQRCPLTSKAEENIAIVQDSLKKTLGFLLQNRRYREYFAFYQQFKDSSLINAEITQLLHSGLLEAYWDGIGTAQRNLEQMAFREFEAIARVHTNSTAKEMALILNFRNFNQELSTTQFKRFSNPATYDDDLFQSEFEYNLNLLTTLSSKADELIKSGHPEITLQVTDLLNRYASALARQIRAHRPQGVPEEFTQSFVGAMNEVADQLEQKGASYRGLASEQLNRHELTTTYNFLHTAERFYRERFHWSYSAVPLVMPATSAMPTNTRGAHHAR
jgi:hypothetical protein